MGDPSACVSSRIQDMMQQKSEIKSEIEASKTSDHFFAGFSKHFLYVIGSP
jgi:hypothetical protein